LKFLTSLKVPTAIDLGVAHQWWPVHDDGWAIFFSLFELSFAECRGFPECETGKHIMLTVVVVNFKFMLRLTWEHPDDEKEKGSGNTPGPTGPIGYNSI